MTGNVLFAFINDVSTPWSEWRAYDATDYRVLYSPELPERDRNDEAVRVLVFKQLSLRSLQGKIETIYGIFHASDGMLILESGGATFAWDSMEPNFGTEMDAVAIKEMREYFRNDEKEYEDFLTDREVDKYERRVDEYFTGERAN